VERKKGQRYSGEFRRQAVERMNACDNIVALTRELGVGRRLLYVWRDRFDETDPPPQRTRELILRKQILKLKRLLANKTLEVDNSPSHEEPATRSRNGLQGDVISECLHRGRSPRSGLLAHFTDFTSTSLLEIRR
jgi:transposase-like protein